MPRNLAALVIGNALYAEVPVLLNPVNDADDISGKLDELGFAVQTLKDASIEEMRLAVADFGTSLATPPAHISTFGPPEKAHTPY